MDMFAEDHPGEDDGFYDRSLGPVIGGKANGKARERAPRAFPGVGKCGIPLDLEDGI